MEATVLAETQAETQAVLMPPWNPLLVMKTLPLLLQEEEMNGLLDPRNPGLLYLQLPQWAEEFKTAGRRCIVHCALCIVHCPRLWPLLESP